MQTVEWMSYLGSPHFSDKISYKTLSIPSYGLEDMDLARFKYFLELKKKKQRTPGTILTQPEVA
jgi:hypothetical protein